MHNHWLFVQNVFAHLVASMSGVVSFSIAIWEAFKNKKIESRIFFIVGALFLIVACDEAWQDEHRSTQNLITDKLSISSDRDFWKNQSYDKDAALRGVMNCLARITVYWLKLKPLLQPSATDCLTWQGLRL